MTAFPRRFRSVPLAWLRARSWRVWAAGLAVLAGVGWALQGLQDPKMDTSNTVAPLKAQYLFQFAKGNDWPAEVKDGPFLVGVQGNPDFRRIGHQIRHAAHRFAGPQGGGHCRPEAHLRNAFETWRGEEEQVDDVLVVSVRVP